MEIAAMAKRLAEVKPLLAAANGALAPLFHPLLSNDSPMGFEIFEPKPEPAPQSHAHSPLLAFFKVLLAPLCPPPPPSPAAVIEFQVSKLASQLAWETRGLQKVADTSPMGIHIMAEGSAVGHDTVADGEVFGRLIDKGPFTIAFGSVGMLTRAEASIEGSLLASSFVDIDVHGADFIIEWSRDARLSASDADDSYQHHQVSNSFIAIDFDAWDLRGGPVHRQANSMEELDGILKHLPDLLSGNISTFDFDVQVRGRDTYAAVDFQVLSLEDQLSSVQSSIDMWLG